MLEIDGIQDDTQTHHWPGAQQSPNERSVLRSEDSRKEQQEREQSIQVLPLQIDQGRDEREDRVVGDDVGHDYKYRSRPAN